ncbi:MAG: hypothetical protein M9944_12900 [Rhizobiaceae bacterium]|nr:hypothetical protein [Rhizobiaceae bacterium]
MREYVILRKSSDYEWGPDAEDYLARTVYESEELIDIGVLDSSGNKVMARKRMDPIGFVRRP